MPSSLRHLALVIAVTLPAFGLSACGTINEKLAVGVTDSIPQWLGGLPADAPPRPGTAKYEESMREREKKRLAPAPPKEKTSQPSSSGLDAVH